MKLAPVFLLSLAKAGQSHMAWFRHPERSVAKSRDPFCQRFVARRQSKKRSLDFVRFAHFARDDGDFSQMRLPYR